MSELSPFAFSISPAGASHWTWRAKQRDGRIEQGAAPTRAVAAACVVRVLARSHLPDAASPEAEA